MTGTGIIFDLGNGVMCQDTCLYLQQVDYFEGVQGQDTSYYLFREHDWNRYVVDHFIGLRVDVHSHYLERIGLENKLLNLYLKEKVS